MNEWNTELIEDRILQNQKPQSFFYKFNYPKNVLIMTIKPIDAQYFQMHWFNFGRMLTVADGKPVVENVIADRC